jgi:hypothetical protein
VSRHKPISTTIKDIVIVLLVISAVFLGWKSRLFGNSAAQTGAVLDWFGSVRADGEDTGQAAQFTEAAKPMCIVVTNAEGDQYNHYGVKYDMDEIDVLYGKTVLIFSEALGSAPAAGKVSQADWETALKSRGIFFEYLSPVKLSVLAGWYGSEITEDWGDFRVRRLCVVDGGDKNRLFFVDEETGDYYAADTMPSGRIADLAEASGINSALFAFDVNGGYGLPGRYTLLLLGDAGHPVVNAVNPLANEDTLNQVLLNLGIGEHERNSYPDKEGINYVKEDFRITQKSDGTLVYKRTDSPADGAAVPTESEAIELARQQIAVTIAATCGTDAAVYFDSIERTDAGGYEVFFSYVVAGGVVHLYADGYAAAVSVYNGAVTEMELHFRNYTVTNDLVQLLPEVQTAAASSGAFRLCYLDNGRDDPLEPVWIASGA